MKLIDSHAHLDFENFHSDFDEVLARANETGVEKIINIGVNLERSKSSILLAEKYPNISATIGIHPEEVELVDLSTIHNEIMDLAKSSRRVVAIGETGLDYYRDGGNDLNGKPRKKITENEKNEQKKLFEIQIEVAKHLNLPLVIHIRNGENNDAVKDAAQILEKSDYKKGVIHCFTFGPDEAKIFTDLGFFLGFTGIVTYKNAKLVQEAVKATPIEKILIETDCPFLAPQKFRGDRNEPAYVVEVAKKVAEIKSLSLLDVVNYTTVNSEKLFKI